MRIRCVSAACAAWLAVCAPALAAECRGRPDALGTARVLVVDPAQEPRIGSMQYGETLPLAPGEVVLTFDDGPLPQHTASVLEALAAECVHATFFMVGRMARAYPEWVRRIYNAGHTVATHTEDHPYAFHRWAYEPAVEEIDSGIASVTAALGDRRALAPFFRFPGFRRSPALEAYLEERGIAVWSADVPADDWRQITPEQVLARALHRLARKGRGVLLLHDIQARTALALPALLAELKARGYRIVHVVPPGERPASLPEPVQSASRGGRHGRAVAAALPAPGAQSFGFPSLFAATLDIPAPDGSAGMRIVTANLRRPGETVPEAAPDWPAPEASAPGPEAVLDAPSPQSLDLSKPLAAQAEVPVPHAAAPPRRTRAAARTRQVRLRGSIDAHSAERAWSRQLNWFQ